MTDGQVLEFSHATKRFGVLTAVDDLSARIEPGAVTAFLGPNGAGKTTSLRMLLGQVRPTSGTATIGGVPHAELRHPLRTIGSVLEEAVYRPRRTAPRQLAIAAKANGIPLSRVDEVLALVGLQNETETRIGAFSLGMRQRLSVAGALLGDPGALVLDEPANGLDPEGIRWMRLLMRRLADEGRTVLVSSHVLSEIEQVADNVLVLSKGRLVYADSIGKLSDPTTGSVVVDADDRTALAAALRNAGLTFDVLRSGLTAHNTDAAAVGAIAASAGVALTTLQQRGPSLEEVFLDIVHGRRAPLTGTIPVVGPPAPENPDEADSSPEGDATQALPLAAVADTDGADEHTQAVESDADTEGSDDAQPAEGSDDAPSETRDEQQPDHGLFDTAAAPVIAAAGAGVAGLFGAAPGTPEVAAELFPVPTTRREAAEYAAAKSAEEGAEEPAGAERPAGDADTVDAGAVDAGAEDAAHEAPEAALEATNDEGSPWHDEASSAAADDATTDESHDADSPEDRDEAGEAPAESEASPADGDDERREGDEDRSTGEDGTADEATAIAAGVALTAPIAASGYAPGESDAGDSDADAAGNAEAEPLTHAPATEVLGAFQTGALTIPDAAPVSFDDLITGVPAAGDAEGTDQPTPEGGEEQPAEGGPDGHPEPATDGAQDESDEHSASEPAHDDAPTAATTVIGTTPTEDAFADPGPSTDTTEIAGIEIFAALAQGRTQEIQVIFDGAQDDDGEDVTQGEIPHEEIPQDEDPRAAAVSASLAAAARAFYSDDAPTYTPGPAGEEGAQQDGEQGGSVEERDDDAEQQGGEQQDGADENHEHAGGEHEGDDHPGDGHDGGHGASHRDGEHGEH